MDPIDVEPIAGIVWLPGTNRWKLTRADGTTRTFARGLLVSSNVDSLSKSSLTDSAVLQTEIRKEYRRKGSDFPPGFNSYHCEWCDFFSSQTSVRDTRIPMGSEQRMGKVHPAITV